MLSSFAGISAGGKRVEEKELRQSRPSVAFRPFRPKLYNDCPFLVSQSFIGSKVVFCSSAGVFSAGGGVVGGGSFFLLCDCMNAFKSSDIL